MKSQVLTLAILMGCSQTSQDTPLEVESLTLAPATPEPLLQEAALVSVAPQDSPENRSAGPGVVTESERPHTEEACATFTLRRGETLAHFARWAELPIETIADHSHLDLKGQYPVGTSIMLPIEGEHLASTNAARDAHHIERAEGYLERRGGSERSQFLTVATGDTAWSIAREDLGIPVWLLETYNPSVDLESLKPGQELMYPIIGAPLTAEVEGEESSEARLALQ